MKRLMACLGLFLFGLGCGNNGKQVLDDLSNQTVVQCLSAIPGNGQVDMSWTPVNNAVSYNVYYSTTPGQFPTQSGLISNTKTNSYTDTGRTNGTQYFYFIAPVDSTEKEGQLFFLASATPTANASGNLPLNGCPDMSGRQIRPITPSVATPPVVGGGGSGGVGGTPPPAGGGSGGSRDATTPYVISVVPSPNASNVAFNSQIMVVFNEAINTSTGPSSITSTPALSGSVSVSGSTLTLTPSTPMAIATTYLVTVNGVKDATGNPMAAPYSWRFTTARPQATGGTGGSGPVDTTPPTITSVSPSRGEWNVKPDFSNLSPSKYVEITFSEPINRNTVANSAVDVMCATSPNSQGIRGGSPESGMVSYPSLDPTKLAWVPLKRLMDAYNSPGGECTITVSGIADLSGNTMSRDQWTFYVDPASAGAVGSQQPPVCPTQGQANGSPRVCGVYMYAYLNGRATEVPVGGGCSPNDPIFLSTDFVTQPIITVDFCEPIDDGLASMQIIDEGGRGNLPGSGALSTCYSAFTNTKMRRSGWAGSFQYNKTYTVQVEGVRNRNGVMPQQYVFYVKTPPQNFFQSTTVTVPLSDFWQYLGITPPPSFALPQLLSSTFRSANSGIALPGLPQCP